jgi:hypothetical protein
VLRGRATAAALSRRFPRPIEAIGHSDSDDGNRSEVATIHKGRLTAELSGARAVVWAWHFISHASAPVIC